MPNATALNQDLLAYLCGVQLSQYSFPKQSLGLQYHRFGLKFWVNLFSFQQLYKDKKTKDQ